MASWDWAVKPLLDLKKFAYTEQGGLLTSAEEMDEVKFPLEFELETPAEEVELAEANAKIVNNFVFVVLGVKHLDILKHSFNEW